MREAPANGIEIADVDLGAQVWSSDLPSNTTGPVVNASIYRPADGLGDSISAATVSVTASATVYELALALLLVAALMLSA